jgi:hypothetical protein
LGFASRVDWMDAGAMTAGGGAAGSAAVRRVEREMKRREVRRGRGMWEY